MKHATLSAFLLIAFGFSPFFGMLGGGDMNYEKAPAIQQSAGDTGETRAKGTSDGTARQKTAENHGVGSCTDTGESTCPDPGIHVDK